MRKVRHFLVALALSASASACVSLEQVATDSFDAMFWSALGLEEDEEESLLAGDRARDERVNVSGCGDLGAQLSSARATRDNARLRAALTTGPRNDRGISASDSLVLERRSEDRVIALEREGERLRC